MKRFTALAYQIVIVVSLAFALALAGVWAQVERNLYRSVPVGFAVRAPAVTLLDASDRGLNTPLAESDIRQLEALPAFRDLVVFAPIKTSVSRSVDGEAISVHVSLCTTGLTSTLEFLGIEGRQLDALTADERSNAVILSRTLALQLGLHAADIGRAVLNVKGANGPLLLRGIVPDRVGLIDGVTVDAWVSDSHRTLLDQLLLKVEAGLRPQLRPALPVWYAFAPLGAHTAEELQHSLDSLQQQRLTKVTVGGKEYRYRPSDTHWRTYAGVTAKPQAREDARRHLRWLTVLFAAIIAAAILNFVTYHLARLSQEQGRLAVSTLVGASPIQLWRDAVGRTLAPVLVSVLLAIVLSGTLGDMVVKISPLVPLFPTGLSLGVPFWVSAIGTSITAGMLASALAWRAVVRLSASGGNSRITMTRSQRFAHVTATAAQVAITTAFVSALGAVLWDVYQFRAQPWGFERDHRYWLSVSGDISKGAPPLPDRLRLMSSVLGGSDDHYNSLSIINGLGPLGDYDVTEVSVSGRGNPISARLALISKDFFRVSGIPLVQGTFGVGASQVVISASAAESLNIHNVPQAVHFAIYGIDFDATVMGIAHPISGARDVLYVPADDPTQFTFDTNSYLLRTSVNPQSARAILEHQLSTWHQSVERIMSLSDALDDTQSSTLIVVQLLQAGAIGLAVLMISALVASLGFEAASRSREFAVKNLLGATAAQLLADLGMPFILPLLVSMLIGGVVLLISWRYIAIGIEYISAIDLVFLYLAASVLTGLAFVGVMTLMGRRASAMSYD